MIKKIAGVTLCLLIIVICYGQSETKRQKNISEVKESKVKNTQNNEELATFAGGCFWCMEGPFEDLDGVIDVVSGYTGGHKDNPTYREVCSGDTGHAEAVRIRFNPDKISYEKLLDVFWKQIDPTDAGGSFVDRGSQYRSAIFFHSDEQKKIAEKSKEKLEKSGKFDKPIATTISKASKFWIAEDYHQNYYITNSNHYKMYRSGSGRDNYIKKTWKDDPSKIESSENKD